jgi:hypothetical protein
MADQMLAIRNASTALLVAESEHEIKEAARKLMRLTPNGNRLSVDQATDLAVYAFVTGLNPFNNECYYMEKVGPIPGIAGYRVKAQNWLLSTTKWTTAPRIWEEYRPATADEAEFDPNAGDVAWVCILRDSESKEHWETNILHLGIGYHQMGATFQEAHDAAIKDAGPCPSWSAVGVVKASEHFSGNVWKDNKKIEDEYKPEMWDRNERAKKRAAKGCYRKAFPSMVIPNAEYGEVVDAESVEVKTKIVKELIAEQTTEEAKPKQTPSQINESLGFGPDPVKPTPAADPQSAPVEEIPEVIPESQPEPTTLFPTETAKAPATYTGALAKIGKNLYPTTWAQLLMSNLKNLGGNTFEIDGILQKLALPQATAPGIVLEKVETYLAEKSA